MNQIEIAGNVLAIVAVLLGLAFTGSDLRDAHEARFVRYFYASQALFLVVAARETVHDAVAVSTRKRTQRAIARAARAATGAARDARAAAGDGAEPSPRTPSLAGAYAKLRTSISQPGADPAGMPSVRNLEILNTFVADAFHGFVDSWRRDARDTVERELRDLCRLNADLEPYVADDAPTNNFSNSHTAIFYRDLERAAPHLVDVLVTCEPRERHALSRALRLLEREFTTTRRLGVEPFAVATVEPIDRSSVLYYLLVASDESVDVLRHLFLRLVKSNARLGATRGTVQRFLAAEILQRAFRAARARAAARRLGTSVALATAQFARNKNDRGRLPAFYRPESAPAVQASAVYAAADPDEKDRSFSDGGGAFGLAPAAAADEYAGTMCACTEYA